MSSRRVRRSHSEGAECVYSVLVTERREVGGGGGGGGKGGMFYEALTDRAPPAVQLTFSWVAHKLVGNLHVHGARKWICTCGKHENKQTNKQTWLLKCCFSQVDVHRLHRGQTFSRRHPGVSPAVYT